MAAAAVFGLMLTSCGGSGSKSGMKSNELLGNLPGIHAGYAQTETSFKEKAEKIAKSGDWQKALEQAAKEAVAARERYAKFKAEVDAEWKKVDGRDVPFTSSDAFKQLNIQVNSVKLSAAGTGLLITVAAKNDFTLYSYDNIDNYTGLRFRVLAKDGTTIDKTMTMLIFWSFTQSMSFKQGDAIKFADSDIKSNLHISSAPEKWVDFASVEFITADEFNQR